MRATWKPHEKHGRLTKQSDLPDSVYAFPKERKEPLTDASHVRNAIARFDQVQGVSAAERAQAFSNIKKAATYYGVHLSEKSWHDLMGPGSKKPRTAKKRVKRSTAKRATAKKASSKRKRKTKRPARR